MLIKLLEDFNHGSLLRLKGDVFDVEINEAAWLVENGKAELVEQEEKEQEAKPKKVRKSA